MVEVPFPQVGSRAYKARQAECQALFRSQRADGAASAPSPVHEALDELLREAHSGEDLSASAVGPDDDEAWLSVDPEELDALMERYGAAPGSSGPHGEDGEEEEEKEEEGARDRLDGEVGDELEGMVRGMREFMGAMGGVEGAEYRPSPATVSLDVERLLKILQGGKPARDEGSGSEDEAWWGTDEGSESDGGEESFDEEEGAGEDDARHPEPVASPAPSKEEGPEAEVAAEFRNLRVHEVEGPDSDDEEEGEEEEEEEESGQGFFEEYMVSFNPLSVGLMQG
jgi:hypothetical protein